MKNSIKYILLFVIACLCSFVIYFVASPTSDEHQIGILYYEK